MKVLPADEDSAVIAAEYLLEGKVIAFPTETVYGIGTLWGNINGMQDMCKIKGRDAAKPFQVLIPSVDAATSYAQVSQRALRIMGEFFPGPLTLVLPDGQGGTTGLRMPRCEWLISVMRRTGGAIVATSANPAGVAPATSAAEVEKKLQNKIGLLIDGGKCEVAQSSTVAALDIENNITILRAGAISKAQLEKI